MTIVISQMDDGLRAEDFGEVKQQAAFPLVGISNLWVMKGDKSDLVGLARGPKDQASVLSSHDLRWQWGADTPNREVMRQLIREIEDANRYFQQMSRLYAEASQLALALDQKALREWAVDLGIVRPDIARPIEEVVAKWYVTARRRLEHAIQRWHCALVLHPLSLELPGLNVRRDAEYAANIIRLWEPDALHYATRVKDIPEAEFEIKYKMPFIRAIAQNRSLVRNFAAEHKDRFNLAPAPSSKLWWPEDWRGGKAPLVALSVYPGKRAPEVTEMLRVIYENEGSRYFVEDLPHPVRILSRFVQVNYKWYSHPQR